MTPERAFAALTDASELPRWWGSTHAFRVTGGDVDLRVGGAFEVCMCSPSGDRHWSRGRFVEVIPGSRLVIDMEAEDAAGRPLFKAYTEVDFTHALGGTRLDVVQTYTLYDPAMAAPMVGGAREGWRTTLEKLEALVIAWTGAGQIGPRSVVHGMFQLERTYDAPVSRVWLALTDEAAKSKWFGGTPGRWQLIQREMDIRAGGREVLKGRWEGGVVSTFDAIYHDVVPNERLVYSYDLYLATMELAADGAKTRLKVTEQGAFLDGYDDAGSREHGTGLLLDAIGASLKD